MIKSRTPSELVEQVAFLFAPDTAAVIDIFRALGDFEDHYDLSALDQLEARLSETMSQDEAKGVVSDSLLLAFSLRRERCDPLDFAPFRSRRGTLDEYRLLALIGAALRQDADLAAEAAASLRIVHYQALVSLASDLALRLRRAGVELDPPAPRMVCRPTGVHLVEVEDNRVASGDLKLNFDF